MVVFQWKFAQIMGLLFGSASTHTHLKSVQVISGDYQQINWLQVVSFPAICMPLRYSTRSIKQNNPSHQCHLVCKLTIEAML